MHNKNNNKIWQAPWGYPESFAVVSGVVFVGLMLQMAVGSFDFYLLAYPINISVLTGLIALSAYLGLNFKKNTFARWFSGVPFSVAIISAFLLLSIIMGVTPQMKEVTVPLGFNTMTSNWAFVFVYTLTLISLGALIVRRVVMFKVKDIPFYFNHIGLWLLLMSSGLGNANMQRYIMYVNEGETEWRVYDAERNIKELPIAITLHDFNMDFYPSRKMIVDIETGEVMKGNTDDYKLGEKYRMIMSSPEPRTFRSEVDVYTESGESVSTTIMVNKPLRIGSWTIYQYGYDNQAGNKSSYSSFELVYDSWVIPVYVGIILMMLGSITMIWLGRDKKGVKYDLD
ncbi:MAG: cytochrome c biogenesis protein ResB [Rikenellaceae bacterium]